jgi:hypothetical protein
MKYESLSKSKNNILIIQNKTHISGYEKENVLKRKKLL